MAFKWLAEERFNGIIEDKKPTSTDYEYITRLLSGLQKIKPVLEQKFPDGSPFPSGLFKKAVLWERTLKPKEEAPPPPPQASSPTAATVIAAPAATGLSTPAEPMDSPKKAQGAIRKAALFLIEKEPTKPMGYRLLCSVRWDLLEKAPPAEGGKTQLPPPNPQQRTYFQNLVSQNDWKTIIEKGEAAFVSGANHLWLDLQRLIATACKELGSDYHTIRSAVITETALLLKRIPDLPSLAFSDGSALCDDATKDWIHTDVATALGTDAATGSGPAHTDTVEEEQRTINRMVAAGQLEEALTFIQTSIRSSASERDNFRRTIIVGTLLLKAKQADIAVSVLEALDQKIDLYNLAKWEPDLAVDAWSALIGTYKVSKTQKPQNLQLVLQDKQNAVLSKISHIDPRKAFSLNK